MKLVISIIAIILLTHEHGKSKIATEGSYVQIKLSSDKISFTQTEPIKFELSNTSSQKTWIMVGYQIKRKTWEDALEDAVNDPRSKVQILFLLRPHKKKYSATYDNASVIAEQHQQASYILAHYKDSLTRKVAYDILKNKTIPYTIRLIARYGHDPNKLTNRTYSAGFSYHD